jgi:hypothetical protein
LSCATKHQERKRGREGGREGGRAGGKERKMVGLNLNPRQCEGAFKGLSTEPPSGDWTGADRIGTTSKKRQAGCGPRGQTTFSETRSVLLTRAARQAHLFDESFAALSLRLYLHPPAGQRRRRRQGGGPFSTSRSGYNV